MLMTRREHFSRLQRYYSGSRYGYNLLLWGSKHFGYHPGGQRISERHAQLRMQHLVAEKLKLGAGMDVLDAGCGQGVVATYIATTFGCKVSGITAVPFEVHAARKLANAGGVSAQTRFTLMDYSRLDFRPESFDAICTLETLSHAPNIDAVLRGFLRVLRPGGRIALFEYSLAPDKAFSEREMDILNTVIYATAMAGLKEFRHDQFGDKLERVGFVDVTTEEITESIKPSLRRLYRFAILPYIVVRALHLQRSCPNVTAAIELAKMVQKGLIKYNIYIGNKPNSAPNDSANRGILAGD